jgi:hypothetical protein
MKPQDESMNLIIENFLQIFQDHHFKVTQSLFDLMNQDFKKYLPFLGTSYEIYRSHFKK